MSSPVTDLKSYDPDRIALIAAAEAAGAAAARFFVAGRTSRAKVRYKANNSPVTEADVAADAAARAVLGARFAGVPILSEEDDRHFIPGAEPVLVIDPIDGTRAFMAGRSEWCVSIALLADGLPVAGVVHASERGLTYSAAKGTGAFASSSEGARRLRTPTPRADQPLIVTGPNRLVDELTEYWPPTRDGETLKALAFRLASVADGLNDVALATSGANHWDIAAADIILSESGCALRTLKGKLPVYNSRDPLHPALIAAESRTCEALIAALANAPV